MRHLKAGRRLSRDSAHKRALIRNMVTALLEREKIRTTLAKAKELRRHAEKTITLGKKGTLHARRNALKVVHGKAVVQKLFGPLAERYAQRKGGYTRIIRVGTRPGDQASMAIIELVDRAAAVKKDEGSKDKAAEKKQKAKAAAAGKEAAAKAG